MFPILDTLGISSLWQAFIKPNHSRRLGWMTGGTFLLLAAGSLPVAAQTTLVDQTFANPNAFGWRGGASTGTFNPCLTAGDGTTDTTPGLLQSCGLGETPGNGVLRLTTAGENQATFAFYNYAIPSSSGLDISFDFFSYGGQAFNNSNGDGITFFLFDGATPNSAARPGSFGGSLGYAQKTPPGGPEPGLVNGVLGVGFDEFGNFANDNEGRASGAAPGNCTAAGLPTPAPGVVTDSVTVRGAGSGQTGYCFLGNSGSLVPDPTSPNGIDNPGVTTRVPAQRTARITLTQDGILTVSLLVNGVAVPLPGLSNLNILQFPGQAIPPTLKFGFASSTGSATNIHEIRNLTINSLTDAPGPDLAIAKASVPASFAAGGTGEYTLTVTNVGQNSTFGPVTVTDTLPPGFTLAPDQPANPGWSCSAPAPGTVVTCVYSGDALSTDPQTDPPLAPGETQILRLQVNVPAVLDNYTNTATVQADGDTNLVNNTATLVTPVTDIINATKSAALVDANNDGAANAGEAINYSINIANLSSSPTTNTVFADQIPAGSTYVPGTTTLNGVAVPDVAGNQMPFAGNGSQVNNVGSPPGILAPNSAAIVGFQVAIDNPVPASITQIVNQGTVTSPEILSPPLLTSIVPPAGEPPVVPPQPTIVPIGVPSTVAPNFLISKLITNVTRSGGVLPGVNFNAPANLPNSPAFNSAFGALGIPFQGVPNIGADNSLQSGDEVEYTVYFLSNGGTNAINARICDAIPAGTTFIPNSFGAGIGMLLNQGGTQTPLTNASDTDQGTFASPLTAVTTPCPNTNNPTGAVFFPLGDVLNIAPNNAGFVRFRVKID
ncbi:MAG: hypothetical protein WBG73_00110 [Coleofasciculaceae cyanobacterium]